VRPHTVRRPRLALGDGAATRVSFVGSSVCIAVGSTSLVCAVRSVSKTLARELCMLSYMRAAAAGPAERRHGAADGAHGVAQGQTDS